MSKRHYEFIRNDAFFLSGRPINFCISRVLVCVMVPLLTSCSKPRRPSAKSWPTPLPRLPPPPVSWQHINLHGKFNCSDEAVTEALHFDLATLLAVEWELADLM